VDELANALWRSTLWYVPTTPLLTLSCRRAVPSELKSLTPFSLPTAGVQQVLPKDKFGALTVLHIPNKNYRRVGKYRNRKFADGTEVFEMPHESLLTAMELHLAVRRELPSKPQLPYKGIRMVDEVTVAADRTPLLERRMQEFVEYEKRGGILSKDDMTKVALVEEE
jgi:hypothetical protein